jgi:hypothetical protein
MSDFEHLSQQLNATVERSKNSEIHIVMRWMNARNNPNDCRIPPLTFAKPQLVTQYGNT